jgi:hypothetical protein
MSQSQAEIKDVENQNIDENDEDKSDEQIGQLQFQSGTMSESEFTEMFESSVLKKGLEIYGEQFHDLSDDQLEEFIKSIEDEIEIIIDNLVTERNLKNDSNQTELMLKGLKNQNKTNLKELKNINKRIEENEKEFRNIKLELAKAEDKSLQKQRETMVTMRGQLVSSQGNVIAQRGVLASQANGLMSLRGSIMQSAATREAAATQAAATREAGQAQVAAMEAASAAQVAATNQMGQDLSNAFTSSMEHLGDQMAQGFQGLSQQVADQGAQFQAAIGTLGQRIDAQGAQFQGAVNQLAQNAAQDREANRQALTAAEGRLQGQLHEHDKRITANAKAIKELNKRLKNLEKDLGGGLKFSIEAAGGGRYNVVITSIAKSGQVIGEQIQPSNSVLNRGTFSPGQTAQINISGARSNTIDRITININGEKTQIINIKFITNRKLSVDYPDGTNKTVDL